MSTDKKMLVTGASGSNRTINFEVRTNRVDVHIMFVQPGGEARIVGGPDGINYGPFHGLPSFTDSIIVGLDLARDTYLAVEYTNAVDLNVDVLTYDIRQK